jgi:hypothetical protein
MLTGLEEAYQARLSRVIDWGDIQWKASAQPR